MSEYSFVEDEELKAATPDDGAKTVSAQNLDYEVSDAEDEETLDEDNDGYFVNSIVWIKVGWGGCGSLAKSPSEVN